MALSLPTDVSNASASGAETSAADAQRETFDEHTARKLEEGDAAGESTNPHCSLPLTSEASAGSNSNDDVTEDESREEEKRGPSRCRLWADAFYAWMYPLSAAAAANGKPQGGGAPRLEALDAPRWIASIQIVCYHMYHSEDGYKRYSTWMACWTQLFFLLSGFVLSYAELAKPPKTGKGKVSILRYVRRRLTVIYPAFFLSLLLKVTYAPGKSVFDWLMLPLHGLLLQSWVPICTTTESGEISCSPWMYNGEAWFLSVLVVFWFFLRPLAEFFRRRSLAFSSATLVVCWLFSFVYQVFGRQNQLADWLGCEGRMCSFVIMVAIRATPIGYFHVFIAGVASARIFMLTSTRDAETGERVTANTKKVVLAEQHAPRILRYGCCFGYGAYAAMILGTTDWIKTHYYFFHNGGMLPVMALVLIGAAIGRDPITVWIFRSKPFLVLGRISYLQYLMQHVLQGWIKRNFGWEDNDLAKALFIPALLVFSYCCQRWVEKPYTEYQRWKLEKGVRGCDDRYIDRLESMSSTVSLKLRGK